MIFSGVCPILNLQGCKDDQIEFTNYANNNIDDIYIDDNRHFFNVETTPLYQVKNKFDSCFLHANFNGQLEDFLLEEHNIIVPLNIKIQNYIINIKEYLRKLTLYSGYHIDNLIKYINNSINQHNFTLQYQENSNHPLTPPQTSYKSQD